MYRISVIAFEDLDVRGMQQNQCLAKSFGDAAWGMFVNASRAKLKS